MISIIIGIGIIIGISIGINIGIIIIIIGIINERLLVINEHGFGLTGPIWLEFCEGASKMNTSQLNLGVQCFFGSILWY